ncbi:MAG: sigma-54-dependent Fis family transcriptional regulator [Gammaproteobacteria bacterium]|nr:sigma-54-dependent Fis family transcriptional regulator [Gammaproteobacteria bacterium]
MTPSHGNSPLSSEIPLLTKRVLIVEDETLFARSVQKRLQREGFASEISPDLASARRRLRELAPDLVLLDMRLPDGSGLDLLAEIRTTPNGTTAVLVMSAYGELDDAVSAMKQGATDYLKKPVDLEELVIGVRKVLGRRDLEQSVVNASARHEHQAGIVDFLGACTSIEAVRSQVRQIARLGDMAAGAPPTVLILGETGTGKDVVARLLHSASARRIKPFVHVDCASLPKDLIEAELFGHEKGAFTSAHVSRTGLIEAAEDGVLFMDEIGELPPDLQAKLLAVLERRTVRRVGTTQERAARAWFVAATNRDIPVLVARGEFRADLYYRLNVITIIVPPLRERGADILALACHFAALTAKRYGLPAPRISPAAERAISSYSWPGNVRELRHTIERAVLLSGGQDIGADVIPIFGSAAARDPGALAAGMTLDGAELALIKQALERCKGNVSRAARELGVTRMALRYRIRKYGL